MVSIHDHFDLLIIFIESIVAESHGLSRIERHRVFGELIAHFVCHFDGLPHIEVGEDQSDVVIIIVILKPKIWIDGD